jgi:YVTN family beta-propeller protein
VTQSDVSAGPETRTGQRRDSPYFGLDYFRVQDGAWFFGREAESDQVITNLQAARLTLLHAESGVGKSSLIRAGVAWRLRQARESNTIVDVPIVFSSWKDDPVNALIDAIDAAIQPFAPNGSKYDLPRAGLDDAMAAATEFVDASLVVLLDQFEEYFLYRSAEKPVPDHFADELARCINHTDLAANFLIAIREDAYARLGDLFKGRIPNVYGNYLPVAYLDRTSAEEAIRKPIAVYNRQPGAEAVQIEDALVEAVLDQVRITQIAGGQSIGPPAAEDDGANGTAAATSDGRVVTPLLQLVMETIWERERAKRSQVLRLSTLTELKGVETIVDSHLLRALDRLGNSRREIAIDLLDHLVDASGGKIAASVADLARRTGHTEEQTGNVLERLDDDRIVKSVQAPPGRDPERFRRYEIFHDVLVPAITRAIAVRVEARKTRRARTIAGLAVALAVVALGLAGTFIYKWKIAVNNQPKVSIISPDFDHPDAIAISPDGQTAYVVDQESHEVIPVNLKNNATGAGMPVGKEPVAIAISPFGTTAYVANYGDNTVTELDLMSGTVRATIKGFEQPTAIAITPDGSTAYVANYGNNTVARIDLETATINKVIHGFAQPVAIALDPSGSTALVANQGTGTVMAVSINEKNDPVRTTFTVGQAPVAVAVAANGDTAYVVRQFDAVTPIDLDNNTALNRIVIKVRVNGRLSTTRPVAIAITPNGAAAYVADYRTGTITPIRLSTNTALAPIHVWPSPGQYQSRLTPSMPIAISPQGTTAYVANFENGYMSEIRLPVK